jgi:[acyl-carrier-protein] S-malonyltransferase
VATNRVLNQDFGLYPSFVAGHSIGEYAACVQAGVISLADAILAVRIRGQAMQDAVPPGQGGMAAIMGLTEAQAYELCTYANKNSGIKGEVTCANFNSPGQIVVSGPKGIIDFIGALKGSDIWGEGASRLKVIPLNVSAPFHCPMMKPAQEKMAMVLSGISFQNAQIPVIQNVDAKAHHEADEIRKNLIEQVSAPVKWTQTMNELKAQGVTKAIEVGYGKVLLGLFKKSETGIEVMSTQTLADIKALEQVFA